jgi:hypothetical protein
MTTGRCRGRRCLRLNRLRWGSVGGCGAPGRGGHVSELRAEHVLADLAGGCEREAAREQPAGGGLVSGEPAAAEFAELGLGR